MPMHVKSDCRLFLGDRPCAWGGHCDGCGHYAPRGKHIVVVKLAAAGDVLRTTSILPPLKRTHPDSYITWVTDPAALPLIEFNPYIDRALRFSFEAWLDALGRSPSTCSSASTRRRAHARSHRRSSRREEGRIRAVVEGSRGAAQRRGALRLRAGPLGRHEVPREHDDLPRDLLPDRRPRVRGRALRAGPP